jgi:hypothetical protein
LSDELSFKLEDLFSLKEVQKFINTKEELINLLNSINDEGVIKFSNNEGHINLRDNYVVYNFINVPNKMNREKICQLFDIKEGQIQRLYKQSLYWVMVTENEEFTLEFEKKLIAIKFEENNLKYDITSGKILKKQILKKIQHYNYIKETDDLKALSPNTRKESFSRASDKISTNALSNSESFSWRKKSDMSNNSKDE